MVAFEGQLTKAIYVRALRLHMRPRPWVLVAFGLGGLYLVVVLIILPLVMGDPLWLSLAPLLVLTMLGAFYWYSPNMLADRALRTSALLREPLRGVATESAIQLSTAHGAVELPWSSFFQRKSSPDMVLLYSSAVLYHPFPREYFAGDGDWQTFSGWAESKVPRRGKDPSRTVLKAVVAWLVTMGAILVLWWLFQRS